MKWNWKEWRWEPEYEGEVDWHKEPVLRWDPHQPQKDSKLFNRFRFVDRQHAVNHQEELYQREVDARMKGFFKRASDGPVRLGSQDTYKHFRGVSPEELQKGRFTRPIVVTDIETGHNDQVISVAAIKGVIDKQTGEFRALDTYERYYTPEKTYSQSFNMAREVHKLTAGKIEALRRLQQATYNEKYNQQEAADLLKFMHGSLVVGHNVEEFDFTRLGIAGQLQNEDILDTMVWAENAGAPRGKRGLAKLFKHYTGRSMEKAGYSHHFGFHDVLSNAELLAALYTQKGRAGRDLRFVATHKGFSYGAYEGVAGTAIIKGGYYKGRGPRGLENYMYEDEFDEKGVFEYDYDENGRRILPEGFSETGEWDDLAELGMTQANMFKLEAGDTFRALRDEMARVRETMLGYSVSQKHALVRYLASKDPEMGRRYLKGLGYSDNTIEDMMGQALPLRYARERKESERKSLQQAVARNKVGSLLGHMYRRGDITERDYNWLIDVNNEGSGFSAQDIVYMAREDRDELADRRKRVQEHKALQGAATFGELSSFVRDLNESPEVFDRKSAEKRLKSEQDIVFDNLKSLVRDLNEQEVPSVDRGETTRKIKYLDNLQKKKLITEEQHASLELVDSYEDLVNATDNVIEANQRLAKTYQVLGSIKPYDLNQLIGAAEGQWGGIKHAAKGVIPSFIRTPLSRLGDAAFNSIERSIAPWNAAGRIFNALTPKGGSGGGGIGGGLTDGIGGWAQFKAGLGVFNGATQVAGNVAQAKVEMMGLSIQNNLNTLGAMISWISTPFQLLHKALKLAIGSLGGFTFKLNNFMGNGIGLMTQMGNPLTNLTGVEYNSYMGTTMMDAASLLGKGTINKSIEGLASQQQLFYTLGQVDTNRLVASSLLGVYGDVYTPNQDPQQQYMNIANKLVADMKSNPSNRARIMSLAPLISNELAQLVQTADLLGVDDVSVLADPSKRGMYWNPIGQTEAGRFRWTQYEYGASKEQFGVSKMRFADTLWRAGGKQIYSALNELVDAAATGNWDTVLKRATDMWDTFKAKFDEVWNGLKDAIGQDEDNSIIKAFKAVGLQIENIVLSAGMKILDVWNSVMSALADKMTGALSYLSTIKITPKITKDGLSFSITSMSDINASEHMGDKLFDQRINGLMGVVSRPAAGMDRLTELYDILFPNASDMQKSNATIGTLYNKIASLHAAGLPSMGLSGIGFDQIGTDEASAMALLDNLLRTGMYNGDLGDNVTAASAAFLTPQLYNMEYNKQGIYNKVGIGKAVRQFGDDTMDVVSTLLAGKYNDNVAKVEILFKDATGKKAMVAADSDGNVVTKNMNLLSQMVPNVADLAVNLIKG